MRLTVAVAVAALWSAVSAASPAIVLPEGAWTIDSQAAVQIFDCGSDLCGRIIWLQDARDLEGQLSVDKRNPDPSLRKRQLCGLTILGGLRHDGPSRWASGWFYNPDDGKTYTVKAELASADVITARIYAGLPLFGKTKTLLRVPRLSSDGWC